MNYGLLGIITLLPFVSPLPVRAEDTPEIAVVETTAVGDAGSVTTPLAPSLAGGGEGVTDTALNDTASETILAPTQMPSDVASQPTGEPVANIDPCAICPVPVVATVPSPVPPEPVTPVPVPTPIVSVQAIPAPAATPAPSTTLTPTTPPAPSLSGGGVTAPTPSLPKLNAYRIGSILINEFVADPADGVEWIEIVNTTEDEISLAGWMVKDATTAKTALPDQILPAHAYFVLKNPKGKLNNDGDSIFLFDGTGATIDAISYSKSTAPKKGKSLAKQPDGSWIQTDPTPLAPNTSPLPPPSTGGGVTNTTTYETTNNPTAAINSDTATQSPIGITDPAPTTPSPVRVELTAAVETGVTDHPLTPSLAGGGTTLTPTSSSPPRLQGGGDATPILDASEIGEVPDGETVTVDGVVVGLPGVFGKQLMYLSGLEVYFNKADWPKLKYMTHVQVTGVVQQKNGYARIKISKRSNIKTIGPDALAPDSLGGLEEAIHGGYFSAEGSVTDIYKGVMTLELLSGETVAVAITPTAGLSFGNIIYGDRVAVTGVTRLKSGAWTLHITESSGLTVLNDAPAERVEPEGGVETAALAPTVGAGRSAVTGPAKTKVPWLGGGLLTTSLGALGYWLAKAKGVTLPSFS